MESTFNTYFIRTKQSLIQFPPLHSPLPKTHSPFKELQTNPNPIKSPPTMTYLLQELITDILCRLPVKSLLRFRCVSKPWCSEIDGPDFIKLHLKTNTTVSLILSHKDGFFSVDLDTLDKAVKLNSNNSPIENHGYGIEVVGSCNGLLALSNSYDSYFDTGFSTPAHDLALWNPYTNMYHKLPITEIGFSDYPNVCYGFGYDPVTDDYKLVRLVQLNSSDSELKVYSLKSNSWRTILGFPYFLLYEGAHGVLANNVLHWVVSLVTRELIMGFDLRTEEFFEVPEPDYVGQDIVKRVGVLGGCLYVHCLSVVDGRTDVWVMKEYGVKESWTKLFSMAKIGGFAFHSPLVYSKSGDKVLMGNDGGKLVWYDLRKNRVEKVRILGAPKSFKAHMCVASLVPLSDRIGTNATRQQAQMKRKRKNRKSGK